MPEEQQDTTTDTTSTSTPTTTTNTLEPFSLPRLDWYDADGRIYKDAIIENLNAIEAKLNELNQLDAFDVEYPDISTLSLSDVTLTSDESKIVNLKSFLDIFGLVNYPMELEFSGTTIKKLSYWNSSYNYITRTNTTTSLSKDTKFLLYNFTDNTLTTQATVTTVPTGSTLLACYIDGRAINLTSPLAARLSLLYLLANMDTLSTNDNIRAGTDNYYSKTGQQIAIGHVESKGTWHAGNMKFFETGV